MRVMIYGALAGQGVVLPDEGYGRGHAKYFSIPTQGMVHGALAGKYCNCYGKDCGVCALYREMLFMRSPLARILKPRASGHIA